MSFLAWPKPVFAAYIGHDACFIQVVWLQTSIARECTALCCCNFTEQACNDEDVDDDDDVPADRHVWLASSAALCHTMIVPSES